MGSRETLSQEQTQMSAVDTAKCYVRKMVERECRGWGDQRTALHRIGRLYGISTHALERLRSGRAKSVDAGLLAVIRSAYLDLCERQVAKLRQEIATERVMGCDSMADIETETVRLAALIAQAKAARTQT